jgi:predicted alpha/beta-hydrolase family hydrolase
LKSVRRVSPKVLASRIRQIMDVDELSKLSDVKVPMVYLKPTRDRLVCREAPAAMESANPELDVIHVEGPHFILQANPKASGKMVSDFLKSLPAPG